MQILVGRSAVSLSQNKLAYAIGVCCHKIHKYETNQCCPLVPRLTKTDQVLNLSPLLLFRSDVDSPHSAVVMDVSRWRTSYRDKQRSLQMAPAFRRPKILAEATVPEAGARSLKRSS
jgi:hypothetical protein